MQCLMYDFYNIKIAYLIKITSRYNNLSRQFIVFYRRRTVKIKGERERERERKRIHVLAKSESIVLSLQV